MKTYGIKYIGSKKKLLDYIGSAIDKLHVKTAIDVFTGTTRVAQYLRQSGIQTHTSDLSWASEIYANTFVHNSKNAHLTQYIQKMNMLPGTKDWLSENYSGDTPQSDNHGFGRCWQIKNTLKADAARNYVETLNLKPWEKHTLIASIIFALDKVDNTVGVQQAYLKSWCSRSYNDIVFLLPECINGPTGKHWVGDALSIDYEHVDLAYLDPPYSIHSYATYYHIWDSIVRWDKPETGLKAKRRVDRVSNNDQYNDSMESPWNRKKDALIAFEQLIKRLPAKYVLISYNDESLVPQKALLNACKKYGKTSITEIDYKRNIMSQIGNSERHKAPEKNQKNKELIICIAKS